MSAILELKNTERYFFADPASGKRRLRKDLARQAIVGVAVDYLNRIFAIHAWAGREAPSDFKKRILDTYETYQPKLFGIEANAMQELFGALVIDEGKERFGTVRLIGVSQSTKIDKDFRIRTSLDPIMAEGRLFILGERAYDTISSPDPMINELIIEIQGFPTAATKDLVDALASAINLVPRRHKLKDQEAEIERLARYLRLQGVPGYVIEERIAAVRFEHGSALH